MPLDVDGISAAAHKEAIFNMELVLWVFILFLSLILILSISL